MPAGVEVSWKAKYPGNCRVCGHRFEKGVSIDQDEQGVFHKACRPAPLDPRGSVRNPGNAGETFHEKAARIDRELARARRNTRRPGPSV